MQVVLVKFRDPTTFGHWASMDFMAESKPRICLAVGFLLEKNNNVIKVGLMTSDEDVSNWIAIPRGALVSMETLVCNINPKEEVNGKG